MKRAEKILKIVEHYGIEAQMGVAQEECAELIQAISKVRRRGAVSETTEHLTEEIADTLIVCLQMLAVFDLENEIWEVVDRKLDRQLERIDKGDKHYEATESQPPEQSAQAKEINALRNELCLKCGNYTLAHEGACNGCRWRRKERT